MKKRKQTNKDLTADLRHIKGKYLSELADKGGCDRSYVWMLLKGKRDINSMLAKKLIRAAKELNEKLEKALSTKAVKDLSEVDAD